MNLLKALNISIYVLINNMASLVTHCAIAKEYCNKNKNADFTEFLRGTLEPDLAQDKNKTHYSILSQNQNHAEILKNKVGLIQYVNDNAISDDFKMGEFLHLITDFLFYRDIIKYGAILLDANITDTKQGLDAIRTDYDRIDNLLVKKYTIDLSQLPEKCRNVSSLEPVFLEIDSITDFINRCANLNLQSIYRGIKKFSKIHI